LIDEAENLTKAGFLCGRGGDVKLSRLLVNGSRTWKTVKHGVRHDIPSQAGLRQAAVRRAPALTNPGKKPAARPNLRCPAASRSGE